MKCPCEDCICVPICRHKTYEKLIADCILVWNYLPSTTRDNRDMIYVTFWSYVRSVHQTLKAEGWSVQQTGNLQFVRNKDDTSSV